MVEPELSIVVLTYNRRNLVTDTVASLLALGEGWPLIVVDNASSDGTADALAMCFPSVTVVRSPANLGAAGRNLGVAAAHTKYIGFCDDDTCWQRGALGKACGILDSHERVAVLSARILVGAEAAEDPACTSMSSSPLDGQGLPGQRLLGFMAGASVMRASAFAECGGYEPRLFIGAEESLLALDLAARGWDMVYCPEIVTHHNPSHLRDSARRRRLLARNAVWVALLRLPAALAWYEIKKAWRATRIDGATAAVALEVLKGLPWVLGRRRPVPVGVAQMHRQLAADSRD